MLTMCTLDPVNKILGGERKQSQGSYVTQTPVQQAYIAKYALINGNKASTSTFM